MPRLPSWSSKTIWTKKLHINKKQLLLKKQLIVSLTDADTRFLSKGGVQEGSMTKVCPLKSIILWWVTVKTWLWKKCRTLQFRTVIATQRLSPCHVIWRSWVWTQPGARQFLSYSVPQEWAHKQVPLWSDSQLILPRINPLCSAGGKMFFSVLAFFLILHDQLAPYVKPLISWGTLLRSLKPLLQPHSLKRLMPPRACVSNRVKASLAALSYQDRLWRISLW